MNGKWKGDDRCNWFETDEEIERRLARERRERRSRELNSGDANGGNAFLFLIGIAISGAVVEEFTDFQRFSVEFWVSSLGVLIVGTLLLITLNHLLGEFLSQTGPIFWLITLITIIAVLCTHILLTKMDMDPLGINTWLHGFCKLMIGAEHRWCQLNLSGT